MKYRYELVNVEFRSGDALDMVEQLNALCSVEGARVVQLCGPARDSFEWGVEPSKMKAVISVLIEHHEKN